MKKMWMLTLALGMVLSLAACGGVGANRPSGNAAAGGGTGSSALPANKPQEGIAIYSGENAIAFEITHELMSGLEATPTRSDVGTNGLFKLDLHLYSEDIYLLLEKFGEDDTIRISYSNNHNTRHYARDDYEVNYSSYNSFKLSYEIVDDTLRLLCLDPGFRIADARPDASVVATFYDHEYSQSMIGRELAQIETHDSLPDWASEEVSIASLQKTTLADFPYFQYLSPATDDYYLTLSPYRPPNGAGSDTLCCIWFDEKGNAIASQELVYSPEGMKEYGGSKLYENDTVAVYPEIPYPADSSGSSKEIWFIGDWVYIQSLLAPDATEHDILTYFSKPTLHSTQMQGNN